MNIDTRVAVISAVTALMTSGLVALLDYTVRERDMDIKMMEMAVDLLKEDPQGPLKATRAWAIDLVSYYSKRSVPLPDDASVALKNYPLFVEIERAKGENSTPEIDRGHGQAEWGRPSSIIAYASTPIAPRGAIKPTRFAATPPSRAVSSTYVPIPAARAASTARSSPSTPAPDAAMAQLLLEAARLEEAHDRCRGSASAWPGAADAAKIAPLRRERPAQAR